MNEAEAEHATSTIATETNLDQILYWRIYISFN